MKRGFILKWAGALPGYADPTGHKTRFIERAKVCASVPDLAEFAAKNIGDNWRDLYEIQPVRYGTTRVYEVYA